MCVVVTITCIPGCRKTMKFENHAFKVLLEILMLIHLQFKNNFFARFQFRRKKRKKKKINLLNYKEKHFFYIKKYNQNHFIIMEKSIFCVFVNAPHIIIAHLLCAGHFIYPKMCFIPHNLQYSYLLFCICFTIRFKVCLTFWGKLRHCCYHLTCRSGRLHGCLRYVEVTSRISRASSSCERVALVLLLDNFVSHVNTCIHYIIIVYRHFSINTLLFIKPLYLWKKSLIFITLMS